MHKLNNYINTHYKFKKKYLIIKLKIFLKLFKY